MAVEPTDRPHTNEDVKAVVQERGIRFIRLWFTDILGSLKSFSINSEQLDDAFEGGMGFDGSSITGFNAIEESDMIAVPDPTTFAVLPWRPEDQGGAMRFSQIANAVPDLSDRLLSERLKELEARGIVERRVQEGTPVRVEYELTERGRDLHDALLQLKAWGDRWLL